MGAQKPVLWSKTRQTNAWPKYVRIAGCFQYFVFEREAIMAGHSKWANIQHKKARQDANRAKIYTKLNK